MGAWAMPLIVGLAAYAATALLLAALVGVAWRLRLRARPLSAASLLALRLFPSAGAAFLTATLIAPAFFRFEPRVDAEVAGPLVIGLALMAVVLAGRSLLDVWRAIASTRRMTRTWRVVGTDRSPSGLAIDILDVAAPMVAIVGVWRPRLVVGRAVVDACTAGELAQVVAHEEAHATSRDNLKQVAIAAAPDPLAWMATGRSLEDRWRLAAEDAADEQATARDPQARIELASALVKVARLAVSGRVVPQLAIALIGMEGIERRVRRLLDRRASAIPVGSGAGIAAVAFTLVALAGVYAHEAIHAGVETLVALGR